METAPALSLLSVVVIGRNEGPRLIRCLESIKEMENPGGSVEVIYVDSCSTDGSCDAARQLGAWVVAIHPSRPTAALGRNAGWRASSGEYILFLDGDTILHPAFVLESLRTFNSDTAIVFGNRREIHPEASIYNRVLDLDWICPVGNVDFCGGDALVRREALLAVDGFDENLIAGEEPEMCRRLRKLGWKILHADLPMTGHDLAITRWSQYYRRALRSGYAYAEVSDRFRRSGMPFWEYETRHNRNHALAQAAITILALLLSVVWQNAWPVGLLVAIFFALSVRSAAGVARKTPSFSTRLLCGIHSHLQQIPIYIGQLQYWGDRRNGRTRGLVEYKEVSH